MKKILNTRHSVSKLQKIISFEIRDKFYVFTIEDLT